MGGRPATSAAAPPARPAVYIDIDFDYSATVSALAPSDDAAIRSTLALYCHRCDDGDIAGVVDLFIPDGIFTFGRTVARGSSALAEFFHASQGRPEQRGKHLTVNSVMEPGTGVVRVVSDFLFLRLDENRIIPAMAGRYDDTLVRTAGRWQIARRDAVLMKRPT